MGHNSVSQQRARLPIWSTSAAKPESYDPYRQSEQQLVTEFARDNACSRSALGRRALEVEHTGSTSVPALAAKPIIGILPVVAYCEVGAA
jgi:GrpB-like predicted nucleotidyltransferase (UPF0157 family)